MTATRLDTFAPATAMLRALRSREISAVELLDLHLDRVARCNPALNAIVIPDFDNARNAAQAADAALARGEAGALLGLPITLKESMNVRGLRTTVGMVETADWVSSEDGPIGASVRSAGAVLIGKTNVPPLLSDWQSNNPVFGRTNNPWDLERTPGGSTGGGAAALAAGLTPLEYGSDIGGSIRVPAAFCGVYGHKPSETAIPRSGQFPVPPAPNAATAMGVQGPLARSAEDLELGFDVAAGPEVGEHVAWRLQIPAARHERLASFRVAALPLPNWLPIDDEVRAAFERRADELSRAGASVTTAAPSGFGDLRRHHEIYQSLLTALMMARVPAEGRAGVAAAQRASGGEFAEAAARGTEASAAEYIELHRQRELCRAAYRDFFREWDILLAPITIAPAFPHFPPEESQLQRRLQINGRSVEYMLQLVLPGIATLSGQPATAFPVGLTRSGLPLGLQAIGPYLEDRTPIRFAALMEREFGGFRRPPAYE
ncbi:MAG TPA: amidase [Steroidobacteraceae bacterium]|nr:amidase [Steroidobacteraceae bacterium]